jgi:hypothetical protein
MFDEDFEVGVGEGVPVLVTSFGFAGSLLS